MIKQKLYKICIFVMILDCQNTIKQPTKDVLPGFWPSKQSKAIKKTMLSAGKTAALQVNICSE